MNDCTFLNLHNHRGGKSSDLKSNSNSSNRSGPFSLVTESTSTHAAKKWDVDTHANKLRRKKTRPLKGWLKINTDEVNQPHL